MSEVLHASALNLNSFVEFILNYYWFEIQNKIKTTRSQPQLVEASGGSTHNKTFQLLKSSNDTAIQNEKRDIITDKYLKC